MKVTNNISVVGSSEYLDTTDFQIYAAKNPFWSDCKTNELISNVEGRNAIAVNIVDAESPMYFKVGLFKRIVRLISDKIQEGESVTIVCNKGVSRSASIALLYLAATRQINRENFKSAKEDFLKFYPPYNPGRGISAFLNHYWLDFFPVRK